MGENPKVTRPHIFFNQLFSRILYKKKKGALNSSKKGEKTGGKFFSIFSTIPLSFRNKWAIFVKNGGVNIGGPSVINLGNGGNIGINHLLYC